ncbi:FAD-dependent oxidoreductase [Brevibacterium sp. NPDC049920]|uniref:FAD-dependent oxidoreductase n=1 Tax=Brevibacterium sp. NPDC049920 TaxID=3155279 RepID=UPI0025EECBF4|nr:FAD-dependent oxidoreductase [uncultured Brevibacterium sp.]
MLGERGVEIRIAQVAGIESDDRGAQVNLTDGTGISADFSVLATGAWSRELAKESGFFVPVADLAEQSTRTHSLLGLTEPVSVPLQRIVISDRLNVRPRHDGKMWVQVARLEERVTEGQNQRMLDEVASEMEVELERFFGQKVPMEKVYYSGRSFPEDGHSIVGFLDEPRKVYTIVTHSGIRTPTPDRTDRPCPHSSTRPSHNPFRTYPDNECCDDCMTPAYFIGRQ